MPLIGSTNVKGFCKQRHILKLKWVLYVQSEMTLQRMYSRIVYFFIPFDLSFY